MNAPFKTDPIHHILAGRCVSVSELKKNPAAVIAAAREQQVAVLNRNRPVAYLVSPEAWENVLELLEDLEDSEIVRKRLAEPGEWIEVSLDDL